MAGIPTPTFLAPFVEALVLRIRDAQAAGKLDDDELDRRLSAATRPLVEGACSVPPATALADLESLVGVLLDPLDDEAAVAPLASALALPLQRTLDLEALRRAARALPDGPGFVLCELAGRWLAAPQWAYAGRRDDFEVRLAGLGTAQPGLKRLLGALLTQLVLAIAPEGLHLDFDPTPSDALVLRGRSRAHEGPDSQREARLHRVALIA